MPTIGPAEYMGMVYEIAYARAMLQAALFIRYIGEHDNFKEDRAKCVMLKGS